MYYCSSFVLKYASIKPTTFICHSASPASIEEKDDEQANHNQQAGLDYLFESLGKIDIKHVFSFIYKQLITLHRLPYCGPDGEA